MYEYKFVKIELKSGLMASKPKEDYQTIITEHAKEGWRFVQIFAPSTVGYGSSAYFELIFERKQTI
ncbi:MULTISPECIES: DUF4177 domain-containing protein [Bacillus]|uniref:DUF4177 domain-containing protein n=1 Tax=Bacillus cytotoxicus TaxID=580165 RepID=A0ACC6A0N7_9BACI|nr:DUF4177 domain-containing protein [Bacillus sp. WLY-B-L8]MCM3734278.1 DUF4177 domain-containing protein [Bacillus cytotoxicus]MDP7977309.1 DUF4177 domain-containing protein [Bacillus sp. WLY-B-L8]HDX9576850.1 DUF4177 domain-containing protein [Bacillus pseudomycoides]HDX9587450.1 DUF4177 domain-containing protein [Bacillus pseudomycoides]